MVPNPAPQIPFSRHSHALLTQVASAYGTTADFDESIPSKHVHFYIEPVDFFTAMRAAGDVTGTFWVPLSEKQILVAATRRRTIASMTTWRCGRFTFRERARRKR